MSTLAVNAISAASGGTVTITGAALTTPALGTPASGTLTNCTGLPASSVVNTPAGGISATTVQGALEELDSEKVSKSGGTMTDNLTFSSGKGIDFSATGQASGMTSELLNDYEEGAWTPTISGSTTAGTGTYSSQIGSYTRIGRQVTVYGRVVQTNNTGTGNIRISNLPFALAADYACGSIYASGLALTAGYYPVIFMSGAGSTYININQVETGTGTDANVPMDTACDLTFSITYFV